MLLSYNVSYNKNSNFVSLVFFGKTTIEEHLLASKKTYEICKKHKCLNLIVDMRKLDETSVDMLDCLYFGKTIAKEYIGFKIANVLPNKSEPRGFVEFTSTVEHNSGVLCQDFSNIKDAINWLKS